MQHDKAKLKRIYQRTDGRCHICGKKLSFCNYAKSGDRGSWEIEHSIPKAKGGTDHLNNLYAACINCNRKKKAFSSKSARAKHSRSKAPLSKKMKVKTRKSNAAVGVFWGSILGGLGAGLPGIAIGAAIGLIFGHNVNPE